MVKLDLSKTHYVYSIFFTDSLVDHLEFKPYSIHSDEFRTFINEFCKVHRTSSAIVRMYGLLYPDGKDWFNFIPDFVFEHFFVEKDGKNG